MTKPKVILVDDHKLFRDGIKTLLELDNIVEVIAEASDGLEFVELLNNLNPDLVLMDIDMPNLNGIEATVEALKRFPDIKILALSMFGEYKYYDQMIEAGARGFILKTANKSELENAIHKVLDGKNYFSEELLLELVDQIHSNKKEQANTELIKFNDKEIGIMKLMCQGYTNEEIAEVLFLTSKTVANYRNNMLNKTGCKNANNLIFYALKNNIIEL